MSYGVVGHPSPLYPDCYPSTSPKQHNGNGRLGVEESSNTFKPPTVDNSPGFKWRLVIAYDGTRYAGWQFQMSPPTIQCVVEKALIRVTKLERKDLLLVGASRTDTGVHAWGQVAHFITPFNYDSLDSIHAALNGLLPSDIRVREISPAVPEFHARFSAKSKVYYYKGALLQLEVEGSGFLYRQVRNMVALLLQIGKEALPPDIVPKILSTRDRRELAKYALSAPPHGLCLVAVNYNEEHLQLPAGCPIASFGRRHTVNKYGMVSLAAEACRFLMAHFSNLEQWS
ncbi:tRNA pseudouridine synthase A 1 isoform X2 [Mangifera indica]|uniref:tRNA pseudouridine synthase A 1 isoform X2 n=1 Tax=Mangifera indica TaxID=29780 RepID=UPI001CFB48CC|nr:tRNA pseudouridine synthase A 1 isoform X2 [Mangifera indica]